MPSNREIRKLLRPLLQRRPDLRELKRAVFFVHLTHYLRGAFFSQGWLSTAFTVRSFTMQLYNGMNVMDYNVARDLEHRYFPPSWVENWKATSLELCTYIEERSLPAVQPMVNPREHERLPAYVHEYFDEPDTAPGFIFRAAVGACFNGDFNLAERLVARMRPPEPWPFPSPRRSYKYHSDDFRRAHYLLRLLRSDRSRVPKLLHDWEAFTVKSCGLEKFWTATPFPCDLKT